MARAKLVLWSVEGQSNTQIARRLRWRNATVGKWRQRCVEHRLAGLYDELRLGRPRSIGDDQIAALLMPTLSRQPATGYTLEHPASRPRPWDFSLYRASPVSDFRSAASSQSCSSWLNQVERWFGLIAQRAIRRGSFTSVKDLVQKIDAFVQHYNRSRRPFVWTATADSILEKIARLCSRISGTAH